MRNGEWRGAIIPLPFHFFLFPFSFFLLAFRPYALTNKNALRLYVKRRKA